MTGRERILESNRLRSLRMTCEACPSQWEGEMEDGRVVYIRYRWSRLTVGVGATIDEAVANTVYADGDGNGLDGYMDTQEMLQRTGLVLA